MLSVCLLLCLRKYFTKLKQMDAQTMDLFLHFDVSDPCSQGSAFIQSITYQRRLSINIIPMTPIPKLAHCIRQLGWRLAEKNYHNVLQSKCTLKFSRKLKQRIACLHVQISGLLSYVFRSAKFDAKFFNFFARLFILFFRSEKFRTSVNG